MPVLSITQHPTSTEHRYRIDVRASDIPGLQPPSYSREIDFAVTAQDRELIRWYLEDFLQFAQEPAPTIAKRAEAVMKARGEELFAALFETSHQGRQLWTLVEPHLSSTRIEIATGIAEATAIPWELIRNPHTRTNLALSAQAFVRTQQGGQLAVAPQAAPEKVRILLVICRPDGEDDVPFRSVAGRLVTRLSEADRSAFELDVLRPPTFAQLAKTLLRAKQDGRPYHIVHFDGHGTYMDPKDIGGAQPSFSNHQLKGDPTGPRGFLVFENPDRTPHGSFIDGTRIGALLRDAAVPFLVLNACQSAFAEAPSEPRDQADQAGEIRDEVEAYGSLAQAVMEAGAAGVVAMRYSVYVVTAAQFVAELYGELARGRLLGEAVTSARRNLADEPDRRLAYDARPLQDWCVPVVYEREPLRLWPQRADGAALRIKLDDGGGATAGALDAALPPRPYTEFIGRDETLYALDRAFDTANIVLLHAYAGSGKTATAAEFARWYALTGGVEGPVLFSSFERHLPLARVLDKIGEVFGGALEGAGVQWHAINDDTKRRDIALQVLKQVPVLWIFDNVEPVTGFPAGTPSDWSADEQQELHAFLIAARDTKAKFLLTSRRDEAAWLGDLPRRVAVPPMPMQERLQLAGAIVQHRGKRLADLPDLKPLLRFTRGNPLTILVTVGEALRAGIDAPWKLDAYAAALARGEAAFADAETEGRTTSLGASLAYGFEHAFTEDERKVLALLHLFQGVVNAGALCMMVLPEAEWHLATVSGLTPEQLRALLDRAAEVGLLAASGSLYYAIHPALPWYFRDLFEQTYLAPASNAARRAFVEAMGELGEFFLRNCSEGNGDVLTAVTAEEDNLLAALRLARKHGWSDGVIGAMQGLRALYHLTGRRAAWRQLVKTVVPDFVDPTTDRPLPGRESDWSLITDYRVRLAREDRDWGRAERLQQATVEWNRKAAEPALRIAPGLWKEDERHAIRTLATAFYQLAEIQRESDDPACEESYKQAYSLAEAIGDTAGKATFSLNLGVAYSEISRLRNFDKSERWSRKSLNLRAAGDTAGRGMCLGQLGTVAYLKFLEKRKAKLPNQEVVGHLAEAAELYGQALEMISVVDLKSRGPIHGQLGLVLSDAGNPDRAMYHLQKAILCCEQTGDTFGAGRTRSNAAVVLGNAGRLADALAYAQAALADFQNFGDRAAAETQKTERLIADIQAAQAKPPP